jgi:hypothetical protein
MKRLVTRILTAAFGTSGLGRSFTRLFHALGMNPSSLAVGKAASPHCERSFQAPRFVLYVKSKPLLPFECARLTNHPARCDRPQNSPCLDLRNHYLLPNHRRNFHQRWHHELYLLRIATEITTNFTAPLILTCLVHPHLLALKKPASILFTAFGLGYVPVGFYPVYRLTKAVIHSFYISLRQQELGWRNRDRATVRGHGA